MTDGSLVNTGANTPTAVYGRQSPMVPSAGVSNAVHAMAQPGYSPQQQQQGQLPPKKSRGIFGLLCRCG